MRPAGVEPADRFIYGAGMTPNTTAFIIRKNQLADARLRVMPAELRTEGQVAF